MQGIGVDCTDDRQAPSGRRQASEEKLMDIALWIVLGLVVVIGIYLWSTYNGLVTLNVRVDEAWSDITVQLKRRADLIPNLIETVKGYAAHESGVFDNVTRARAATISPEVLAHPAKAAKAEGEFAGAMKSLFAVAEAYPQLQANQNFLALQSELTDTEDKIMAARRFYNGGVRELNTKIKTFPNNVFATRLGFAAREFFEVADSAAIQEPPQVKF
jgi:LemA protein